MGIENRGQGWERGGEKSKQATAGGSGANARVSGAGGHIPWVAAALGCSKEDFMCGGQHTKHTVAQGRYLRQPPWQDREGVVGDSARV